MARQPITRATPYHSKKYRRTFHTEREYRNFLARRKGFRSWWAQQRARFSVGTSSEFRGRSTSEREAHVNALHARTDILGGLSKRAALERWDLTENAFERHVGGTIEHEGGRWRPTGIAPFRLERMLTSRGERMVHPDDDQEASRVGGHWNAAKGYARAYGTPQEAAAFAVLRTYEGDVVDAERFMTDPDDVLDYYETHPEGFESLYDDTEAA